MGVSVASVNDCVVGTLQIPARLFILYYQAYKDTVSGATPLTLPSLSSFTDEQLFFIAFGQVGI